MVPEQIVPGGMVMVPQTSGSPTLTVAVTAADEQAPFNAVTLYTVDEEGFAVTLAPVVADSPVAGVHSNIAPGKGTGAVKLNVMFGLELRGVKLGGSV